MTSAFLADRQVGDTSPFAFQALDALTREALDISDDDEFWMDMIPVDSTTAKIDRAAMVKNRANSVVTYMPSTSEVDTAGTFTVQVYVLRPDSERLVSAILRQRIIANARTLDFTP